MKWHWTSTALAAALIVGLPACAPEADQEDQVDEVETPAQQRPQQPQVQRPDTTQQAVWSFLQEQGYENWRTWPEKGEMYEGGEPHGALLTTYLNDTAYQALTSGQNPLPDGSIIVKNNYMPDSTLAAVTTMYKAAGFNPEHADWYFAKHSAEGVVDVHGRVDGCQACHGGRSDNDYILTADIGAVRR